ncbi:unnamed protein product [Prunus armeniaca]
MTGQLFDWAGYVIEIQDLHPFPRIEVKLKLQRKVSLFRHHTGEHQFQARKWNTSTWELYALIREYLSLITWLFTWSYHQLWTRKWKAAEDKARATLFGYYGLNFAVYTFPPIALAIIGSFFLNLKPRELIRSGKGWKLTAGFSNPLVVNTFLGVLSTLEILPVFLFILFLAWNFYARISNDFKNLKPAKSLMLNSWQLKYLKVETRFGLLAEVCLAFLLFPILRGLALFRLLGIQFEASVRHYLWLGTAMIFFATFHGASTLFIWGVSHFIQEELWEWQKTGRIYLAGEICLVTGRETCILSARIFPSKAIELILPKDPGPKYSPTSIIFCEGSWTSSLSHMIQTGQESDGDQKKYIPIAVEGPYGPVSMDFLRPNFEADIFAKFPDETGGSDIGVLLYGPETTKESVGHQFARKNVELRSRNPISASTPSISHQKP